MHLTYIVLSRAVGDREVFSQKVDVSRLYFARWFAPDYGSLPWKWEIY